MSNQDQVADKAVDSKALPIMEEVARVPIKVGSKSRPNWPVLVVIIAAVITIIPSSIALIHTWDNSPQPSGEKPAIIDCSKDSYNCSNFKTQKEAQAVYEYCMKQTGRDVHGLDNDKDGIACEGNKN